MSDDHKQAADERRVVEGVPTQLLIGGEWRPSATARTLAVEDPSTGQTLTRVADGDAADALAAPGTG